MPPLITVNKASPPLPAASTFQSQSSFSQKLLNFTFTLNPNPVNNQPSTFSGTNNNNSVSISGHRVRSRITYAGAPGAGGAEISIWGMSQSLMNQLATLGILVDSISQSWRVSRMGSIGLASG